MLKAFYLITVQHATTDADKLRADKDALEAKLAEYSLSVTESSMTAAKAEQDLISNLQTRLKVS